MQNIKSCKTLCRTLLDYTKLFSPNECKRNDKIILKYFH